MRRASTVLVIACVTGCGGRGLPGLAPDAGPDRAPAAFADGFKGAALGWTLGSEIHLFLADSDFTLRVYARMVRPRMAGAPPSLDAAFRGRAVVSLAAESLATRDRATILSAGGAVPAELRLIRLHASGDCLVPGPVTELVYAFSPEALPAAPRSHTPVVGVLGLAPRRPTAGGRPIGQALSGDDARRYIRAAALAAERLTARGTAPAWPLAAQIAVDPEVASDAGEVFSIGHSSVGASLAVGFRVRFLEANGDTVLVSGVAVTDRAGHETDWVLAPVRAPLHGGLLARVATLPPPARYSLRGVVFEPTGDPMLLVDQVADVSPFDSRTLAVAVDGPAIVASQPLALRCR